MNDSRRYNEKEIAAIFEQATNELESSRKERLTGEGLSLTELKEIGAESGIPPDLIARAAFSIDQPNRPDSNKTLYGIPIGASHNVDLPRRLTEKEWESLVVDLRATFNARGKIQQDGAFRQWTNGNLQCLLEPMGDGCRLRMKTTNSNGRSGLYSWLFYVLIGAIMLIANLTSNDGDAAIYGVSLLLMLSGFVAYGWYGLKLPGWAKTRSEQFVSVGERLISNMNVQAAEVAVAEPMISLEDELPTDASPADFERQKVRRGSKN